MKRLHLGALTTACAATLVACAGLESGPRLAPAQGARLAGCAVLAGRLGRAVDRRRVLVAALPRLDADLAGLAQAETAFEIRRINLIYIAISMAATSALLVCLLIALALIDAFVTMDFSKLIAALFILAMVALIVSLTIFLREIFLSINSPRAPVL